MSQKWYVDRSRYEAGHQCKVKRFFTYHYGNGFGIVRAQHEMPLATGGLVHHMVEGFNSAPARLKRAEAVALVDKWANRYEVGISKLGFNDPDDPKQSSLKWRLREQAMLGAGLGLVWWKYGQEQFLQDHEILSVEKEYPFSIPWGIEGWELVHEVRPDLVARHRPSGKVIVYDFKTEDKINEETFPLEWVDSIQMAVQSHAVEVALGERVQYGVIALEKGQLKSDYNSETQDYSGARKQQSPLCYMYYTDTGVGPVQYAPKYQYRDEVGKKRNLGKYWTKAPTWDLPGMDSPLYGERALQVLEVMEPKYHPSQMLCYAGPYEVNRMLLDAYLQSVRAEEEWWFGKLMQEQNEGKSLFSIFPASFQCINAWGKKCPMHEICYRETNAADDPVGSGSYVWRRPHHAGDLEAMKAAGFTPTAQWDSEE